MEIPVDYTALVTHLDDYPTIRVYLSPEEEESGWAAQLAPDIACLLNIPFEPPLYLYDIVRLEQQPGSLPHAIEILQRYITQCFRLRYVSRKDYDNREVALHLWPRVRAAIEDAGGFIEGVTPGIASINAPDGVDIIGTIDRLGLDDYALEQYIED
jgi:hypothetical protein